MNLHVSFEQNIYSQVPKYGNLGINKVDLSCEFKWYM